MRQVALIAIALAVGAVVGYLVGVRHHQDIVGGLQTTGGTSTGTKVEGTVSVRENRLNESGSNGLESRTVTEDDVANEVLALSQQPSERRLTEVALKSRRVRYEALLIEQFAGLFERLRYTSEQIEQFQDTWIRLRIEQDLFAQQRMAEAGEGRAMASPNGSTDFELDFRELRERHDQELRDELGGDYAEYERYLQTRHERGVVRQLDTALEYELSDYTRQSLIDLMAGAKERWVAPEFDPDRQVREGNQYMATYVERGLAADKVRNRYVIDRAIEYLSEEEVLALAEVLRKQERMTELQIEMMRTQEDSGAPGIVISQ